MGMDFSVNANTYDVMPEVIKDLLPNATNDKNSKWLGEAFINRIEGKKYKGKMNLDAFSASCEKYAALERVKKGEVALLDEQELLMGYTGISTSSLVDQKADNDFAAIESSVDVDYYVEQFIDMDEYIFLLKGEGLWRLLQLSIMGNKKAHRELRILVEDKEIYRLKELVEQIIKNPCCIEKLYTILGRDKI